MPPLKYADLQRMILQLLIQQSEEPVPKRAPVVDEELADCIKRKAECAKIYNQARTPNGIG